ncbi:MAG: TIGR01906 family membrane protein [SAR202 cluster bacterium]|nr:TIGR01906 family membrane protein [SAR202 cluster bacterium]
MQYVKAAIISLFVLAVPVFLITTTARVVINSDLLYRYGFERYEIPLYTGIEMDELMSASRQIRDYFNNDEEYLDVQVRAGGIVRSIYNQREVLHMKDVKDLLKGVYTLQIVTGLYILFFAGLMLWLNRTRLSAGTAGLLSYAGIGGGVTLALVVIVGLGALVGFDRLFLAFHLISFSNDFWQLDPSRDYLIAMFPQGFFFDSTMAIAAGVVVEALLLSYGGAKAYGRLRDMERRRIAAESAWALPKASFVDITQVDAESARYTDGHRI